MNESPLAPHAGGASLARPACALGGHFFEDAAAGHAVTVRLGLPRVERVRNGGCE